MNLNEHFRAIERAYAAVLPEWLEEYEATGNMRQDPYLMQWQFSPIESTTWGEIRSLALPFYPQVPACGYFLDFANPFLRIAIECDGKEWHDVARDRARDEKLAAAGWMVFRITGGECSREVDPDAGGYRGDVWRHYGTTSAGLLRAIKWAYFDGADEHDAAWLMRATLSVHRTTPETFPVQRRRRWRGDGPARVSELMADVLETIFDRVERQRGAS